MTMEPERFWAKVKKSDGCWLWLRAKRNGYGAFWNGNRMEQAPRVAWRLTYGTIPDGLHVLHTCDVTACCRPDHLFLGTHIDNMRDRRKKGRCAWETRLTEADVLEIRTAYERGISTLALAQRFKISRTHACNIAARRTWRCVQ